MQPQGHVQILSRMIDFHYPPQAALDSPRINLLGGVSSGKVALESSLNQTVKDQLASMGHDTLIYSGISRELFGKGQIILRNPETGVLWAGSDPRGDGCANGY